MKAIILFIITGIMLIAFAFDVRECDHVFTNVVQPKIKATQQSGQYLIGKIGVHDGNEIICVKCFHRQRQTIEYSEPAKTGWLGLGGVLKSTDTFSFTTVPLISGSKLFLNVDTSLQLIK